MNTCQSCHQREAVVRLTQVAGDDVTTLHLCSKCAAERGIETEAAVQTPLGAFLAAMGSGSPGIAAAAAVGEACTVCGATLNDFRSSGRLGCPNCWVTFERPLRDMLRRAHGATRHTGETYFVADGAAPDAAERQRRELRDELQAAIEREEFERAAVLRDRLRGLTGQ